jgi:tripartite ATP-independent transporter DctP family solute receptor
MKFLKHIRSVARLSVLPICVATLAFGAQAQDVRERVIKFSHVQPKNSHMDAGAQKFADLVAQKSNKKITVRVYPGGSLGGDIQTLSALQGGTIEMTTMPPGLMIGLSKEYAVFDLPFLINSFQEADELLDGPVGKHLLEKTPPGVIGLAYWDHGFRNLTNNRRPVARADDFQGLKIRVAQSPMIINTINGLGANATPMSFTELYSALEVKAVDGQENPTSVIETNKFYEVQKYLTLSRHQYNPLIVIASRKMWDQLTPDERKILTDSAIEARAYQRTVSRDMDSKALVSLKAQGMQVTEISDAERKNIIEKLKPVSEKLAKDIGEPLVKQVRAEIDRIRANAK